MSTIDPTNQKIKLIYISAVARSGSTLLSVLLNAIPGLYGVGELGSMWHSLEGKLPGQVCSCGESQYDCPFWYEVYQQAFGGIEQVDVGQMSAFTDQLKALGRDRRSVFWASRSPEWYAEAGLGMYFDIMENIYQTVQKLTGSRVIVDESKNMRYLRFLKSMPMLDVYTVHLMRDPRGAAFSQIVHPRSGDTERTQAQSGRITAISAGAWLRKQLHMELLAMIDRQTPPRYLQVRLEDLVEAPADTLKQIVQFTGEDPALVDKVEFVAQRKLVIHDNHIFTGNRMRFHRGELELKQDGKWQSSMRERDKALVSAINWPLMLRYGYPLWG